MVDADYADARNQIHEWEKTAATSSLAMCFDLISLRWLPVKDCGTPGESESQRAMKEALQRLNQAMQAVAALSIEERSRIVQSIQGQFLFFALKVPLRTFLSSNLSGLIFDQLVQGLKLTRDNPQLASRNLDYTTHRIVASSWGRVVKDWVEITTRRFGQPITLECFERVVLVHRLREVVAQLGFTRFEALSPDVDGELQMGVHAAPLARETSWLPAVENRGEGIFLQVRADAIEEWLRRTQVQEREQRLRLGFDTWCGQHPHSVRSYPGIAYYMLHSFSHLLLTAVSLECGYPVSSIRERVYASNGGFGILIYTGTADAEGTLGGLVDAGRFIDRHVRSALEIGRLCSNDPVCAQHEPQNAHECRFLHGAACHGCVLVAETSCEQHNDFLDRALIVPTVEDAGADFFRTE